MNREVLESNWTQVRELLLEKFNNLSEEDIRQINGRYDQLVNKLQQRYGYSREEAEERIRNWNFDRFTGAPRAQIVREEKIRKEEDNSSILRWLLALGIPILLLGAYFLSTATPQTVNPPTVSQEQFLNETPADRLISNDLRNSYLSQDLASEVQNIQITTSNGVVTLSGFVSSNETRDRLVTFAQNYPGVNQVINNLQVR